MSLVTKPLLYKLNNTGNTIYCQKYRFFLSQQKNSFPHICDISSSVLFNPLFSAHSGYSFFPHGAVITNAFTDVSFERLRPPPPTGNCITFNIQTCNQGGGRMKGEINYQGRNTSSCLSA